MIKIGSTRRKSFWYHYNKPLSLQRKKPVISIHFDDKCHFVENLKIEVPTQGRIRNKQPRFVVAGKCTSMKIEDNIAYIK